MTGPVKRCALLLLLVAAAAGAAPVETELFLQGASVRPGTPFLALVRLSVEEGWHVYAPEPGDAGLPTTLVWELPEGFTAGPLRWPTPRRFEESGLVTRGYAGELLLVAEITPPADLRPGTDVAIGARVAWLACRQECIPGEADLAATVPVTATDPVADPAGAPLFAAAGMAARQSGPEAVGGTAGIGLLVALLLAFVGGLILNLMPCVLPVLSLKVVGFASRASTGRTGGVAHGLWYTAGVLASFWVIAGTLAALRGGGRLLGWGFQFQDPAVAAAIAILFFVVGLNLFGVFEIGVRAAGAGAGLRSGRGWLGSFAGGLFMTLVATPCTAPFMGAALGYAVARPPLVSLAVFTALGLGVALPYALVSAVPGLARLLPKPGPWMETLKHVMGFPMMAAAAWFVGLAAILAGSTVVTPLLASLLAAGLGVWIWGRWGRVERSRRSRRAAGALALLLVGGGIGFAVAAVRAPAQTSARPSGGAWEPWSPGRVAELVESGTPVFVDFTAAWCLTCRVNEATTLRAPRVIEAFRERGVALLKADWTARDQAIARALEGYGRAGVPLYVLYDGAGGEPVLLPEVLTPGIVLAALEKLR
jgi:thiol:disulfide interchange protein